MEMYQDIEEKVSNMTISESNIEVKKDTSEKERAEEKLEATDKLPALEISTQYIRKNSTTSEDETLEFVDMVTPVSGKSRRRKSSVARRFSVGSFADSVKIELGDNESLDDSESVVFNSSAIDPKDAIYDPRISDFEPLKVLGQGAYGKVLLVRHRENGKLFAQKQLKKASIFISAKKTSSLMTESTSEKDQISKKIERTMAERDILSKIRHQFIVKLFYALQDSSKIYLYLEFVPGGELFHHLSTGLNFLDEDSAAFYAAEMTLALYHLHEIGIVYRDLKPENCLLDSQGHLILTDFGLSKIGTDQDSQCNSIIGTPEYMAPEVLRGETYSFKVDWWSLGTVIFDLLSGKPPFTGGNHQTISNKILKNKVKFPYYFSNDVKELLNKLLNKNSNKRMDVDKEFEKYKKMRFFKKINWDSLSNEETYKQIKAPIVPLITDPVLAENFDEEFTSMKISNYDLLSPGSKTEEAEFDDDAFKGFTYVASNSYIETFL